MGLRPLRPRYLIPIINFLHSDRLARTLATLVASAFVLGAISFRLYTWHLVAGPDAAWYTFFLIR